MKKRGEEQFFHGTISPLKPGTVIEPTGKSSWRKPRFPHDTDPAYAYATGHDEAWDYAEKAWNMASGNLTTPTTPGHPRVFQVEPLGEHEQDPSRTAQGDLRNTFEADRRSKAGWKVISEVQMPEHMGTPEDWR
jgi:hypothetical protein